MRPTHFGWKGGLFYVAMVGTYFAAPYSNVFFLLVSFLTLQWTISVVWTWNHLRGVSGRVERWDPVCGSLGKLRFLIDGGATTRFHMSCVLELRGPDGKRHRVKQTLPRLQGVASDQLRFENLARGLYSIRLACIETTYPLGLFRRRLPIEHPEFLAIYPAPFSAEETRNSLKAEGPEHYDGSGAEMQPAGLREYREGDSIRQIHWRASARRGKPVLREWEGSEGTGIEVLLDLRCSSEELEHSLAILCSWSQHCRMSKEVLRLHSQQVSQTYGEGQQPWSELHRFLAEAQALPKEAAAPPTTSPGVRRLPDPRGPHPVREPAQEASVHGQ